jgi:hypothetical protein
VTRVQVFASRRVPFECTIDGRAVSTSDFNNVGN